MLILGLRHGLDPDHITIIDQFTYKLHEKGSKWTKWAGTLFAFGHGIMVTVIALVLLFLKNKIELPDFFTILLEWIPLLILLFIGCLNLVSLKRNREVKSLGLKKWLIPDYFNRHLGPFSIIITGIIFGFIFDTSTQIAAFGLAISVSDQWMYALMGGVFFSVGMIFTGSFDSFLLSRLLTSFDRKKINSHRYKLNVLITIMCFAIPIYKISCLFNSSFEINDFQNNMAGIFFLLIIVGLYTELYWKFRSGSKRVKVETGKADDTL